MTFTNTCRAMPLAGAGLLVLPLLASAQVPTQPPALSLADKGFSYFIGVAHLSSRYREDVRLLPVRSEAKTSSPLLVTGALYAVTPDVLVSLDNETTFAPRAATETWTATAPVIDGTTLTSPTLQTDRFRLSDSSTRLMGHYRVREQAFVLAGPSFHSRSFRRYGYVAGPDRVVTIENGQTTEETSAEVVFNLGAALESEGVRGRDTHYSVRALVGLPVWRRVENTATPQTTFDSVRGYDLSLEARYSHAVLDNLHLGGWLKLSRSQRASDTAGTSLELPRSRLDGLAYGVELLWKL